MSQTTPIGFPASAGAVTPDWLNRVFKQQGYDAIVGSFEANPIGAGMVASSLRVDIVYERSDGRAPRSIVVKLPHSDALNRGHQKEVGVYARECGFYTHILPTVDVPAPVCYFAGYDPHTTDFVLLLEDMTPAVPGDQIRGCSVEIAERAITDIVKLHAPRWGDQSLYAHRFLAGVGNGLDGPASLEPEQFAQFWQQFLNRYRGHISDEVIRVGNGLTKHFASWKRRYDGTCCITHGDFRLDNVLIDTNNAQQPITIVDWQMVGIGCGAADVAYFLGSGLSPEVRREHERDLLRVYHETLLSQGIADYTFERLWRDYAWYSYSGFVVTVVASIMVTQTERGDRMFMAMAQRYSEQVIDLEVEQLISAA
jgi:hypothetical protein